MSLSEDGPVVFGGRQRVFCWQRRFGGEGDAAARAALGDYLHLTRQHWISSLSLILPGNDDGRHLPAATDLRLRPPPTPTPMDRTNRNVF